MMRPVYLKIYLVLTAFSVLFVGGAAGQNVAGSLDATFGTGGKVVSPIGTSNDVAQGVAVQPDGKIVVVGSAFAPTRVFPIVRYNANGTLDASFGNNGVVALQIGSAASGDSYAVAIQPDGKIVAGGRASLSSSQPGVFVLVRLNTNGTLDATFDGDGKVTTPFEAGNAQIRTLEIQPDGKIVAGGDSFPIAGDINNSKFAVARYNADGSLDTTFDGDGKQIVELGLGRDTIFGIAVQADGKVVATGNRSPTVGFLDEDFAIVRFNVNGSLDTTFDADGIMTFEFIVSAFERPGGIFVQPDGKIVAGGFSFGGGANYFALVRLNTDGSFDTTFDGDGKVLTVVGAGGAAYAVKLQSNGKIVAGGGVSNGTNSDFAVARYNADGSPDTTFGTNGQTITPIGTELDQAYAMAIQPNGKIVLAGETRDGNGASNFALVRYNSGKKNTLVDFNGDGKTDWAITRSSGPGSPYVWWIRYNGTENGVGGFQFGRRGSDIEIPVDYDGDGKSDVAVWRNNGFYYILNSSDNSFRAVFVGGVAGNSPVAADYDGDGKDDPAVFITPTAAQGAGQGNWCYVASLNNPSQQVTCVPWGARYGGQSDQVDDAYPGDFDGDGKADFRVQRRLDPSNTSSNQPAIFYTRTATGQISYDYFGINSDRVLPGDYDGDGKTDLCVARGFNIGTTPPTLIQFFIRHSNGQPDEYINFGEGINFNFAQGDYDGDGKDDLALTAGGDATNPQQRYFWVRPSANPNQSIVYPWGTTGDLPVAGYNNR